MALEKQTIGAWQFYLQYADLDSHLIGGDAQGAALAAMLRAVLPAAPLLGELSLNEFTVDSSSFSGCRPLLASVTELGAYDLLDRIFRSDMALQHALDALISLTPTLHRLTLSCYSGDDGGGMHATIWARR